MNRRYVLLLAGLFCLACPQSGSNTADLGSSTVDQSTPDAQPYQSVLSLVAGTTGGSGNLDGIGTAAYLGDPYAIATDGKGNLIVTEYNSNTIREISLATGFSKTLAGWYRINGGAAGSGVNALFSNPAGIAVDSAGNVFVADQGNCVIRRIIPSTGTVTTIAGALGQCAVSDGVGTAARFSRLGAMSIDSADNLYVSDDSVLRKIVLSTSVVSTVAGKAGSPGTVDGVGTSARLGFLQGMVVDPAGNLYVSDSFATAIRKITLPSFTVTTITGASAAFVSPAGLALDTANNLYVSDTCSVRKIALATNTVSTLAGDTTCVNSGVVDGIGTAARFYDTEGIVFDSGRLYATDYLGCIHKIDPTTTSVTTFAGNPPQIGYADGNGLTARFDHPTSVAIDSDSAVYIADTGNRTIRKLTISSGIVTTIAGSAQAAGTTDGTGSAARFISTQGITTDGHGNLFVADNSSIRRISLSTNVVTTVANGFQPSRLVADGNGNLYVASSSSILQIFLPSGVMSTIAGQPSMTGSSDGTGSAARFGATISGIALDRAGNLYISDMNNRTVRKLVLATQAVTTIAGSVGVAGSTDGTGTTALFSEPRGLAVDDAGNLYVADRGNGTIRKIELASGSVTTVVGIPGQHGVRTSAVPATLNEPVDIALLPFGGKLILDINAILTTF